MRKWFLAAGLIVLLLPATAVPQQKNGKGSVYEQLNLFGEPFERIRQDAVEPVGDNKLIETAIAGMLSGLDPRSVYLNENEYKAMKTPAPEESASPGLVITLDKEPTYDLTLPEIEQKLRGPADSEVALMLRRGTGAPIETRIKRAAGKFPTVSSRVEGGDVAYIRLAGFD